MEFKESKSGEFLVIDLIGPLKSLNQAVVQKKLLEIIERGEVKIVVNCAGLTYISSSGLRIFFLVLKKVTAAGGGFRIAALRDNVREVMVLAGFASIFNIYNTLDEALMIN